jgi:hypothetical protein
MKFPQILMLLTLFSMFIFSCRETNPEKGDFQEKQMKSKDMDTLRPKIAMLE